jgi:hypothetical protein
MKKIWILIAGLLYCSCSADPSQIGVDFFKEGSLDVSFLDSVSVRLSTVKFDSLDTNGTNRMLVGSVVDEKLGRISAQSFMQFQVGFPVDLPDTKISFDYLALNMKYDKYSYYDTLNPITLKAYRVTEVMKPAVDGRFYNNESFSLEPQVLGTTTLKPRPHRRDSIEIKLDPALGQEFFNKAQKADADFSVTERFVKYLRGIAIASDTTQSSSIIGLNITSELRLYYFDRNDVPVTHKFVSFTIRPGYSFSQIVANRGTSALRKLKKYKEHLSAKETDGQAYIQGGAGLALRVDMPGLRDLKQLTNFYITQAVLQIYPVRRTYDALTPIPTSLLVYKVDQYNSLYGSSTGQYGTATLKQDLDLGRDTYYQMDVTNFVKEKMNTEATNQNALFFVLNQTDFKITTNRVYFANPSFEYNTRLRIYFATINE